MTMTAAPEALKATTPRWRGINHLALITTDMDATSQAGGDGRQAGYDDDRFFGDPNPVPAVQELRESGELMSLPRTRLS